MKYAESIGKICQFQLVKCCSPIYYLRKVSINRARRKVSQFEGFWFSLVDCLRIPWISFHTAKNQSVKVLDQFKEQTNRCYSSITFLKSWAYTWALTSSSLRELDNLEGQSASQWVTGINFETKQDWRPQPHPFLEKRSSLKASFHSGVAFQISRRPLPPQRWFL